MVYTMVWCWACGWKIAGSFTFFWVGLAGENGNVPAIVGGV